MVHLEEITNKNIWKVCMLKVTKDQMDFVADNIQSIAEAYATRNEGHNALPLAIYDDKTLVGFVMIGKGTVGNENESELIKNNYVLWRLMIDEKYQHKGYGKKAMDLVINMMRNEIFGKAEYVWLSYEKENTQAKEIYHKYGFIETNEMCEDEIIAIMKL